MGKTYGLAAGPGAEDVGTGSKDIDKLAKVGVLSKLVVLGRRTNGASLLLRGGGGSRGVGSLVTRGDGEEKTSIDNGSGSLVYGVGLGATERHVNDGALGAVLVLGIASDKVHASKDSRIGA